MKVGTYQTVTLHYSSNDEYQNHAAETANIIQNGISKLLYYYNKLGEEMIQTRSWGPYMGEPIFTIEVEVDDIDAENCEITFDLYLSVEVYEKMSWDVDLWRRWIRTIIHNGSPYPLDLCYAEECYYFGN